MFQALSTLLGLLFGSIITGEYQIEWFQILAILPMSAFIFILLLLPDTPLHLLECTTDENLFQDHNLSFQQSKLISKF